MVAEGGTPGVGERNGLLASGDCSEVADPRVLGVSDTLLLRRRLVRGVFGGGEGALALECGRFLPAIRVLLRGEAACAAAACAAAATGIAAPDASSSRASAPTSASSAAFASSNVRAASAAASSESFAAHAVDAGGGAGGRVGGSVGAVPRRVGRRFEGRSAGDIAAHDSDPVAHAAHFLWGENFAAKHLKI